MEKNISSYCYIITHAGDWKSVWLPVSANFNLILGIPNQILVLRILNHVEIIACRYLKVKQKS